jgi:hypothetical protein
MIVLSIVMAAKNDNYGGEVYREGHEPAVPTPQKDRMRLSLYTLHEAFKHLSYELIFVEWNPPEDKEKISSWDFIQHPKVKVIEVSPEFANEVCPERGFHETHAKNIGIRRAKGDLILSINPDCLWLDAFPWSNDSPLNYLSKDSVMIANRPTVYYNVLDCGLDIQKLKQFCNNPENIVHKGDYDSNGDFTLMSKELWYRLQGLSTPKGDMLAGVDMQTIKRAEEVTGKKRRLYPYSIWHVRHPGKPLGSGYNLVCTSENWGFPNEDFKELVWI